MEGIENLKCLVQLSLSHNLIESMKELPYLAELKEIDLSHNKISRIEMLSNMPSLEDLDLGYNQISRVSSNDFAPLKQLITLSLSFN